ncbi:hypothetical protein [Longimicrobium sp.]|uniref:hypothetical protein n=1 Tax=Longimicrobium sp. TaxID=2029185 RepID=UPI002BC47612|nr:hypothetical protein [Longimicrobium sp.]HSU16607.1 hypothetical protein [Longimicrobium sp.]
MPRKLKTLALMAACAAVTLGASQCASSSRTGQQAGGDGATPAAGLAPAHFTRQTVPSEIANWAIRGCRGAKSEQDCLEAALTSSAVLDSAGVDKAMGALGVLARRDPDVARDGHVYAHGIGIAAYRTPETVGQTFARCTADFQSGCYHGVIQAYFADRRGGDAGVTPQKLNGLCLPYRSASGRWLQFQCAHGIGHGLMAVESHNLLRALDSCDLLGDTFEKQACWGGAFMENVVNATAPHHMHVTQVADVDEHAAHGAASGDSAAHAGHGAAAGDSSAHAGHDAHAAAGHEGHDMAGMPGMAGMDHGAHGQAAAETFKALDPNDPLYPCDVVKTQHRQACYLMQTSAILWQNNGDFRDAAKKCQTAPEDMQRTCFISLGRDANSWAEGNRERAVAFCGLAPEVGQPHCIVGVVKNIVDVTADPRDGLGFCRMVPDNSKPACYHAVGEEIGLLNATAEGRERACREATGYVPECRRGARLPFIPAD